ncbi:MAG: hypothetical protein COB38_00600 [Gammaproteobacteria bacterium]|nr:MAG: hypothetical protein COB38_00600 [Gammaproteobacteria bacterium]
MIRIIMFIISINFLTSCGNSLDDTNVLQRRFLVADFCYSDVVGYFDRKDIADLGVSFEFTKLDRRLLGLEHIIGMANVSSANLKKMDIDSLINGSLNECHPNMKSSLAKDSDIVKPLFNYTNFLDKQLDSNYLMRVTNDEVVIYTRE